MARGSRARTGVDPAGDGDRGAAIRRRSMSRCDLGAPAAKDCLENAGVDARDVGMILVSSGSAERRFPGPASAIGGGLGSPGCRPSICPWPAPARCSAWHGGRTCAAITERAGDRDGNHVARGTHRSGHRDTAILFGDGAGACLVSAETGFAASRRFGLGERRRIRRPRCGWISTHPSTWTAGPYPAGLRKAAPSDLEFWSAIGVSPATGAFLMHQANST